MPTISLTNDATLNLTGSSADDNKTLAQYLKHDLKFHTLANFDLTGGQTVGDADADGFPIPFSATGTGNFAVGGSTLQVALGATATVGLLKGDDAADLLSSVSATDASTGNFVSFAIKGTMSAGPSATAGDLTFGVKETAAVTVTAYTAAANQEMLSAAVKRAVETLTIPHDVADIQNLPAGAICQLAATGSLQFTASVTYSILNDPLATTAIPNLPAIAVNATASATLEASVTHTGGHVITVARLPSGKLHLAVAVIRTDDFETSLTASAGVSGKVGGYDAIEFLLGKITPGSSDEIALIRKDMTDAEAARLRDGIKTALDAAVSSSLQVSLQAALEEKNSNKRVFGYEIDAAALDDTSRAAVQTALTGDFRALTQPNARLKGIGEIASALTVTNTSKHSLTLHLLGIFNWNSTNTFIKKAKVNFLGDRQQQIVLSDETVDVALDPKKMREAIVKGMTLTLPASANTPEAAAPVTMVFFDREDPAGPSKMHQFVNVLQAIAAPEAAAAADLLARNSRNYGAASLYLEMDLTAAQCGRLFRDSAGKPCGTEVYLRAICDAEQTILASDPESAYRRKVFGASAADWGRLREAGAAQNIVLTLESMGIPESATPALLVPDVLTAIFWSEAMADYAQALAAQKSIVGAGTKLVKSGTLGFSEPWLILATWNLLGNPVLQSRFTCSLLAPTVAKAAGSGQAG